MAERAEEAAQKASSGFGLAVTVCIMSSLGVLIALVAGADTQSWGAALVVGIFGTIGGIVLALLGFLAVAKAGRALVSLIAWAGIAVSVAGIVLCQLLLQ